VSSWKAALRPLYLAAARRAAQAYVAGDSVGDALKVCRRWKSRHVSTTIGYWNDGADTAEAVQRAYLACLAALARHLPDGYLSIKLGAMKYRQDLLAPILTRAKTDGFRVHFDSLGPETVERTNEEIVVARKTWADLGCTLPGRWRRSVDDVAWAVENDLSVRVVKGQWPDPEVPALDPAEGFYRVVDTLAGRAKRVAVATHDVALAERCLHRLQQAGTPADYELLHGLPMRQALKMARRRRVRVRIYVPYGASFLPYSLDYVQKHPAVIFWLAKDALSG